MSLPSGYAQLAYIKSSGSQYIDTGVAAAKDLKVEAIMDVDESSSWIMILGDYTSSKYFSWWAKGNLAYAYFGSKDGTLTFSAGKHTYIADGPNNKWEIDGTSITLKPASSDFSGTGGTLYLFSVHNGGSYTSASAKLYSCKIYKNGTLIRDFVPCRNASGTLGLYDLTNNRFYGNAGSGDFEGPYYGPLKNSCLIDGATYQINNGKVLIGGTKYQIMMGRTLVDGTEYEIGFGPSGPFNFTVKMVSGNGNVQYYCYAEANGKIMHGESYMDGNYVLDKGTTVEVHSSAGVFVNGVRMTTGSKTYSFEIKSDVILTPTWGSNGAGGEGWQARITM